MLGIIARVIYFLIYRDTEDEYEAEEDILYRTAESSQSDNTQITPHIPEQEDDIQEGPLEHSQGNEELGSTVLGANSVGSSSSQH